MADFHTHITVSTAVGIGFAAVGAYAFELPLATCAIAGGLCSICGIMPDLDSDNAVPARETLSFLAAVAPLLLFYRMHFEGLATENILLFGAPLYLLIRFGFGQMLKVSVHRGMFHSIPAALIAGLIAYVMCDTGLSTGRMYKGAGAVTGYLTHLILDEIWAMEFKGGFLRFKKSFGTAMKFLGASGPANSATWALLTGMTLFAANDQGHPEIAAAFQHARPDQLGRLQPTNPNVINPRSRASVLPSRNITNPHGPADAPPLQSNRERQGWR